MLDIVDDTGEDQVVGANKPSKLLLRGALKTKCHKKKSTRLITMRSKPDYVEADLL